MYAPVKCFWLELTDEAQYSLRRYTRHAGGWTCETGWHEASVVIGTGPGVPCEQDPGRYWGDRFPESPVSHDDERWPQECQKGCGYRFGPEDQWQECSNRLYRRTDTGETMTLRDAPPGAMWDADWLPDRWRGYDGRAIMAKCPNGHEWSIDSVANNCTKPNTPDHRCWIRHGEPPNLTVDKRPEPGQSTCAAGGGSIVAGDYHGFLVDGSFSAG